MAFRWKKGKFYIVDWEDIVSYAGWAQQSDYVEVPHMCQSFGFLSDYKPGKTGYIRLSATRGPRAEDTEEYNQHIVIPLSVIKGMKLKENPGD